MAVLAGSARRRAVGAEGGGTKAERRFPVTQAGLELLAAVEG